MRDTYSLYEAKARLSALVRQVREGRRVTITVHGEPVAELRPVERRVGPPSLEERLDDLTAGGRLVPSRRAPSDPAVLSPGSRKPGALKRFLDPRE